MRYLLITLWVVTVVGAFVLGVIIQESASLKIATLEAYYFTIEGFERLAKLVSWPIFFLIGLLVVLISRSARHSLKDFFTTFSRISVGAVGEISTTHTDLGSLSSTNRNLLDVVRSRMIIQKEREVDKYNISEKISAILNKNLKPFLKNRNAEDLPGGHDFRATVHIPDPILSNTLLQLVDYLPRKMHHGRNRLKSIRFGAIGLAYRTQSSKYYPAVDQSDVEELVERWGMTSREAESARGRRHSVVAICIRGESGEVLGVLYIDASYAEAFGGADMERELIEAIENGVKDQNLNTALFKLVDSLRQNTQQIDLP